jgi:WD40 repeat protein
MEGLKMMFQNAFQGKKLGGHDGTVRDIVVSMDGKYAASASGDHTAKIWNLETKQCISTLGSKPQNLTGGGIGKGHQHIVTGDTLFLRIRSVLQLFYLR